MAWLSGYWISFNFLIVPYVIEKQNVRVYDVQFIKKNVLFLRQEVDRMRQFCQQQFQIS